MEAAVRSIYDGAAALDLRAQMAQSRLERLRARAKDLQHQAEAAARYLERAPGAQEVLDEAQRRINGHLVGGLQTMLTHLVGAVMGDGERAIQCDTEVDANGRAQVCFSVRRSGGQAEDILRGNGGSIANIVSAGLRLIAVQRAARMRKFMVLDEPDCWLSPERVEPFFRVLRNTVRAMPEPIQVLLITHHDVAIQEQDLDTLRMQVSRGKTQIRADIKSHPLPGQIKSVRLINWRSHEDIYLPLGPDVTVLKGDNNIGKSACVEALRCLFYGGARADVVRHGQAQAEVHLTLADGSCVQLIRKAKGSPATIYRWLDASGALLREDHGGMRAAAPPWMQEACAISLAEDIQLHVADQKYPVFLLDEPASKQTAILSVGQEAQDMTRVLERFRERKRMASAQRLAAEKELERLRRLQSVCEGAQHWAEKTQALREQALALQAQEVKLRAARALLARWHALQAVPSLNPVSSPSLPAWQDSDAPRALLRAWQRLAPLAALGDLPAVPALRWHPMQDLRRLEQSLQKLRPLWAMKLPALAPLAPAKDAAQAADLLSRIARLKRIARLSGPPSLAVPPWKDAEPVRGLCASIKAQQHSLEALKQEKATLDRDYAAQNDALEELCAELGACPLCGADFAQREAAAVHRRPAPDFAAHCSAH